MIPLGFDSSPVPGTAEPTPIRCTPREHSYQPPAPTFTPSSSLNDNLFFFFFFQAEDGIRDLTVTGVHTCALPIYPNCFQWRRRLIVIRDRHGGAAARTDRVSGVRRQREHDRFWAFHFRIIDWLHDEVGRNRAGRSEERRVGEECRSRWWPDPYKRK